MKKIAILVLVFALVLGVAILSAYAAGAKKVQLKQWAPAAGEENVRRMGYYQLHSTR